MKKMIFKKGIFFLPLLCALVVISLFLSLLYQGKTTNQMVSPLIGEAMPKGALKDITTGHDFVLTATKGNVLIVNFFASWCLPCHAEQDVLMTLSKHGHIRMIGVVYKDTDSNIKDFLKETGNPFDTVGMDVRGKTALDFGISGVPETFFIRDNGVVVYHHAGPLLIQDIDTILTKVNEAVR